MRWTANGANTSASFAQKPKKFSDAALPTMPCASAFRLRAELRARRAFYGALRHALPEAFSYSADKDEADAA